jgi:hypothetical protein
MKFKVLFLAALTMVSFAQAANASERALVCAASGSPISQNGGHVFGSASFSLNEVVLPNGARFLYNVRGEVRASYEDAKLGEDGSYIGSFNFTRVDANPKYSPRRYLGFTQYANFNAFQTRGREDGMWGQFVLEQDLTKTVVQAHYIFQAGDHMGGTLHMSCRVVARR